MNLADIFIWYPVFVFSTTCHEAAHAWVAHRGGDPTAHADGHVSLDPLPHIRRSPMGMVVIPILSFVLYGWMIGWASVPLNPEWARKFPRRAALMSLAGPAANLSLALLAFGTMYALLSAGVLHRGGGATLADLVALPNAQGHDSPLSFLVRGLSLMFCLNVILGLFNLIPLPPLDGAAALEGAAPRATGGIYSRMREIPAAELLGMLVAWKVFPLFGWPVLTFVTGWL
jgi:Zn-dependent protease